MLATRLARAIGRKDTMRMRMMKQLKTKSLLSNLLRRVSIVAIVGFALSFGILAQRERSELLALYDEKSCVLARAAGRLIPDYLFDTASEEKRGDSAFVLAYRTAYNALESEAEKADVAFIFSIVVEKDGTAFELVSNLEEAELAKDSDPLDLYFMKPYELSTAMQSMIGKQMELVDTYTDAYGTFRSCLISFPRSGLRTAIVGVDMDLTKLQRRLWESIAVSLGVAAAAASAILGMIYITCIPVTRSIRSAAIEVRAVSRMVLAGGRPREMLDVNEVVTLYRAVDQIKRTMRTLSKFLPQPVIKAVALTPEAGALGGEKRELSLLMTDAAQFTTIAEQLPPDKLMEQMTEYFEFLVGEVQAQGGTVDKYVGDGMFAYWNAPKLQPDHAILACRAALAGNRQMESLSVRWRNSGRMPWLTRFGIHAGDCYFGNIGSSDRMDFTVIGSSVNVASRLEGLNKAYGTKILASGRIKELAEGTFVFRPVDVVRPRGTVGRLEIFELLGERDGPFAVPELVLSRLEAWQRAYRLYTQRDWAAALESFVAISAAHPEDLLAMYYMRRCSDFALNPPPPSWDGVANFSEKK